MKKKIKIRYFVAALTAPLPVIALSLLIAFWVHSLPVDTLAGKPDNAPHRAALMLVFLVPVAIYPALVFLVTLQTSITKWLRGTHLKSHILASVVSSAVISALIARGMHVPQFGESFLGEWRVWFFVWCSSTVIMIFTWRAVMGQSPTSGSTLLPESVSSDEK